jgi:hypothetical protein
MLQEWRGIWWMAAAASHSRRQVASQLLRSLAIPIRWNIREQLPSKHRGSPLLRQSFGSDGWMTVTRHVSQRRRLLAFMNRGGFTTPRGITLAHARDSFLAKMTLICSSATVAYLRAFAYLRNRPCVRRRPVSALVLFLCAFFISFFATAIPSSLFFNFFQFLHGAERVHRVDGVCKFYSVYLSPRGISSAATALEPR